MCFICQDTGEIFISPEDRDPIYSNGTTRKEPCPICFNLYELDKIIMDAKRNLKVIRSLKMNQKYMI